MSLADDLSPARQRLDEQARLFILRELDAQVDGQLNELILQQVLELRYAIRRDRVWLKTQLNALENLGAVGLIRAGSLTVAKILPAGRDHTLERAVIAGVARPRELE